MAIVLLEAVRVDLRLTAGTQVRNPKLVDALRRTGVAHTEIDTGNGPRRPTASAEDAR